MTWFQNLDFTLFQCINSGMSNPVFDNCLPWIREKWLWAPGYLFLVSLIGLNFSRKKAALLLLGLVLAVGLSDFTSSTLIKKNIKRLRPCNDPEFVELVQLRVSCGSGYSFTSSHASNHFAVAVYLGMVLGFVAPWIRPVLLVWASLIAFSQVYVGVHYPGDVFFGGLVGASIAWWLGRIFRRWTSGSAK